MKKGAKNTNIKGRIYVMKSGDGFCKIGTSTDVSRRKLSINQTFKITKTYSTKETGAAYTLERCIHDLLFSRCVGGEWYQIDFKEACVAVEACFAIMNSNLKPLIEIKKELLK